jgi:lysyl oxidase
MTRRSMFAVLVAATWLHAGVASAQVVELLPNLEPFSASDIVLVSGANGLELRFSMTSWNKGAGPMELVGGDIIVDGTPDDPGIREVWQQIYRSDGTIRKELVGQFEYHGGTHNHFHLEDYAAYTLIPVGPGAQTVGAKVSFCLLDNIKVNTRLPNAAKRPVYTTCNPDIQGISVGFGDIYRYYLDGQSLPFGDNPSGDYLIKIQTNPNGNLFESNYSDNVACARVRIDRDAMTAAVVGTSCAIATATISEILPASVRAGSSVGVVIHGSGFVSGMNVSFDNGSGKVPVASNVTVVSNDTITATISVASGGSTSDPVWDLRVGDAVLPNAFTVFR